MFPAFSIHFQQENVVSFELIFLFKIISLVSKSVFVTKFACVNLAAQTPAAKLLNSGFVIYLYWLKSVNFFSISLIFVLESVLLADLLTSGILFSTAVNADLVAKPLTLGILLSILLILAL